MGIPPDLRPIAARHAFKSWTLGPKNKPARFLMLKRPTRFPKHLYKIAVNLPRMSPDHQPAGPCSQFPQATLTHVDLMALYIDVDKIPGRLLAKEIIDRGHLNVNIPIESLPIIEGFLALGRAQTIMYR